MKKYYGFILIVFLVVVIGGCSSKEDSAKKEESGKEEHVTLMVSAAASLKDVMEEVGAAYKDVAGIEIKFNYGASGSLQQQISQGAPVDLFFSAAEDKFDFLVEEGIIAKEDSVDLVGNSLVLIGIKGTTLTSFDELKSEVVRKISIGTPETVPAGQYAKQSLQKMNLWEEIESKFVFAKDVRQVLSYVETGNVEVGMVYKTDALSSDDITVIAEASEETHNAITYPVGVIRDSKNYEQAKDFYLFLQSEQVKRLFEEYGFITK